MCLTPEEDAENGFTLKVSWLKESDIGIDAILS